MKKTMFKFLVFAGLVVFFSQAAIAQCQSWTDLPNKDEIEEAHVLYRQFVKSEDYEKAYDYWKKAYEAAPAADGQRPFHYMDGRAIYMSRFNNETDEAKKKEYIDMILKLYDEQIACYDDGGLLEGRKAFDMFYYFRTPYSKVLETLKTSLEKAGEKAEYIILDPFGHILKDMVSKENIEDEKARDLVLRLREVAQSNIDGGNEYKAQYEQALASFDATIAPIESVIFDCGYFVDKYKPQYEDGNQDNPDFLKEAIATLKGQGCEDSEPFLMELESKWAKYAEEENAKRMAEFEANNPGVAANRLYKSGDFDGAVEKYKEAINSTEDAEEKAKYYYSIASITFRKMKNYRGAREYARKALEFSPQWGKPLMLIGDMYASTSSSCGNDPFDKRVAILAALEKWSYAKSVDSSVASEASSQISKYSSYRPEKSEGFMKGLKEGQKVSVNCWIGETVTLRYK